MISELLLINLLALSPISEEVSFDYFKENISDTDLQILYDLGINSWDDYDNFLLTYDDEIEKLDPNKINNGTNIEDYPSTAIYDIKTHLNLYYPDYYWVIDSDDSAYTSDVSNAIPIEMLSNFFPSGDIQEALNTTGLINLTSYGGCGPIASMGVFDYFSRYLEYGSYEYDYNNSDDRVDLAIDFLENTYFSMISYFSDRVTLVWPWNYKDAFNIVMEKRGLSNEIEAKDVWKFFYNDSDNYLDTVKENINSGLPVTLGTGLTVGGGSFSKHYTNVYGYETWVGVSNNCEETLTKTFLKARLNWGVLDDVYCDADILNYGQVALITYDLKTENEYYFYKDDFSHYVNDQGQGQYFFYEKSSFLTSSNETYISTNRLRTSYIENEYLVLSPNREGAGVAFLELAFHHYVEKMCFSSSLWSDKEGIYYEEFKIQYLKNGKWIDHVFIDLNNLSTLKSSPDYFNLLFPKYTSSIRFYAEHEKPSGDRNKGRICLDNFYVQY